MSPQRKRRQRPEASTGPQPVLAIYQQARGWGLVGLGCLLLAGVARVQIPGGAGLVAMLVGFLFAAVFVLVCRLQFWLAKSMRQSAHQLLNSTPFARWEIPALEWHAFLRQEVRAGRWIVPCVTALGAGFGVFVGYVINTDGNAAAATDWTVYAIAGATGLGVGFLVGAFMGYIRNLPFTLAAQYPGQVIFGQQGYYMPGVYRRWFATGGHLRPAEIPPDGEHGMPVLVLNYKVRTKHGYSDARYRLPIPPDKKHDAVRVRDWLNLQLT